MARSNMVMKTSGPQWQGNSHIAHSLSAAKEAFCSMELVRYYFA